jgi:hypothetical protein
MPWDEVMSKFKAGKLHSSSKKGPKVSNKKQALAIMLSEKEKAEGGKKEYQSKKKGKRPSAKDQAAFLKGK